jgi:hypothetical protein
MKDEDGDKKFAIWLLGDSNPKNWQHVLDVRFDPKHPARHSIWTPVLETIQEYVFVTRKNRVKTSPIYVRNAIEDPVDKPLSNGESDNYFDYVGRCIGQKLAEYYDNLPIWMSPIE